MNYKFGFETIPFEIAPGFQDEVFEEESESGKIARQSPKPGSGFRSPNTAGQRPVRSPAFSPARPKKPPVRKPSPSGYRTRGPWGVIRGPYGLVSAPYPGGPEPFGSERVRWVQDSLNRILGLRLPVTGVMGPETRSAVRSFQKQKGLPVSGIVGPDTGKALLDARHPADAATPPAKPAQDQGEVYEFETLYLESPPSMPTLRQGSRGPAVADLQRRLAAAGFSPGAADGIFGSLTYAAVKSFQRSRGLGVDGIVGPQTWGALLGMAPSVPGGGVANVNALLPASGPGFYSYYSDAYNRGHQYGQPETIRAIQAIGTAWQRRYPHGPSIIGVGHISLRGGGDTPDHIGHKNGLEVDFRPVRSDGQQAAVYITDPAYSRALTQELVNVILANGVLKVDRILFNDSGVTPVRPASGHDNHLHVYFLPLVRQPTTGPSLPVDTAPSTGTLRDNIARIAKMEYTRWGNGSIKESDSNIQGTLRDYWLAGVGSEDGYRQKQFWSEAFISWVIKKAGAGNAFKCSAMHGTYIKAAKDNRYAKNSNPFKAHRTTEVKPRIGDLVCTYYDGSWNYDNVQAAPGMHCDIVTEVASRNLTTIGGNVNNSVGRKTVTTDANGYVDAPKYFAVIRVEA